METTHHGQHGADCFGCKLRSIQFGNVFDLAETITEKRREKDLPAYWRLRQNGLQPRSTQQCAELETRANDQLEVELGKLIDPKLLKTHRNEIAEGMHQAQEMGLGAEDMRRWKDNARGVAAE